MPTSQFDGRAYQVIISQQEKAIQTTTAQTLVNGRTVFRVNGGPIVLTQLISYCITANDATASLLTWSADGDVGAATAFTGPTTTLASFIAGSTIVCSFLTLGTVPIVTGTTGVVIAGTTTLGVLIPPGIVTTTVSGGSSTGTWLHYARYMPMAPSSVMAVA